MLTRIEAQKLLEIHCSEKLRFHCREAEVIMKAVAKELNQDEEKWGIAALIHDLDFEKSEVQSDFSKHAILIQDLIGKENLPEDTWHAIASHNGDNNGIMKKTPFDYALSASENMGGFIYAVTLIYPDRKVASVKVKSVTKRLKQAAFARNVDRQAIYDIEKAGIKLDRFVELALQALISIAPEVGI